MRKLITILAALMIAPLSFGQTTPKPYPRDHRHISSTVDSP
jgi:hypothetical protein